MPVSLCLAANAADEDHVRSDHNFQFLSHNLIQMLTANLGYRSMSKSRLVTVLES